MVSQISDAWPQDLFAGSALINFIMDNPAVEWEWLGQGTYGRVLGATVAALGGKRPTTLALKIIPLPSAEEEEEVATLHREAVTSALLSLLDAPSFGRHHHAFEMRDAAQTAAVARLVQAFRPDDEEEEEEEAPATLEEGYLVLVQQRLRGQPLGAFLYTPGNFLHTPNRALALLFQLMWSLGVAEAKLGFEHRDMAMHNLLWDEAAAASPEQQPQQHEDYYTLIEPAAVKHWFVLRQLPGRLVLLDYGSSTTWDEAHARTAVPDLEHTHWGSLLAPEDYFVTRRYAHSFASECYTAGLVAFSILAAPHLSAVLTGDEHVHLQTHMRRLRYGDYDLTELLPLLTEPEFHALRLFKDRLLATLSALRLPAAMDAQWRLQIEDPQHQYASLFAGKALGQALLMRALGLGELPPAHSVMVTAPFSKEDHVWYRLLSHKEMRAFFNTERTVQRLQARCFDGVLARLPPDQVALLRSMLAWSPDARPMTAAVLLHPAFAPLREPHNGGGGGGPAPQASVSSSSSSTRFYSWHMQPPLTALAPQRSDARHMAELQALSRQPIPTMPPAPYTLNQAVVQLAEYVARKATGL